MFNISGKLATATVASGDHKATLASSREGGPRYQSSAGLRLITAAAPAALITVGLFAIMTSLVKVDEVELAKPDQRILKSIIYEHDVEDPVTIKDRRFKAPTESLKPPPPPRITGSPKNVSMPPIRAVEGVPNHIPLTSITTIMTGPQPIGERTATPVRAPMPVYPRKAAERNLEGECQVHFDISPRGTPFNITADCTDRVFESEARRSVSRAEFLPQIQGGQPVESHGAMYPLEFRLNSE